MAVLHEEKQKVLEYQKRRILEVQEKYKVFFPVFLVLGALLILLGIFNGRDNFLPSYISLLITVVGVIAELYLFISLIKGNIEQARAFGQLKKAVTADGAEGTPARYMGNELKGAEMVMIFDCESEFVVMPLFDKYLHKLFTDYDFRWDFGKYIFPKKEFAMIREESFIILKGDGEYKFELL